ncbi:MAG: transposase [Candidatus Brocadiales bacterium]
MMNDRLISPKELVKFTARLFESQYQKAASLLSGILRAGSIRQYRIAQHMEGSVQANHKSIQRFLAHCQPVSALKRLFLEGCDYVLADTTEIERPQAKKTGYVGRLKDGKTRGFCLLVLACPYKGRAIPFYFLSYSSRTIAQEATSRNLEHRRAFREVRELIGQRALVLDREFSYEALLADCMAEGVNFVIRLNVASKVVITDEEGERLNLHIEPGQTVLKEGVFYKGKVRVNLAGHWRKGLAEPLWVITTLPPEEALRTYQARMKIEESFKDLKGLLGIEGVMNRKRENMEKMVAMVLIAYALGLLIGEWLREKLYDEKTRLLFSGLFLLLRNKLTVTRTIAKNAIKSVLSLLWEKTYAVSQFPS